MQSRQPDKNFQKKLKSKISSVLSPRVKNLLKRFYRKIEYSGLFLKLRTKYLIRFTRVQKLPTLILKPLNRVNHYSVEINITYKCNLRCLNCEASCGQAPSEESMSLNQIKKFIDESIEQKRKWGLITILGGEPTLHPQIFDILQQFLIYKESFSPKTKLRVTSNGLGKKVNSILSKIPQGVEILNTRKTSNTNQFTAFNNAPKDHFLYKYADYSNGCSGLKPCGIGLNLYGFYPCMVAGNIDKVLGFNIGRKTLPELDDSMQDQIQTLCKYCGHFMYFLDGGATMITTNKEIISPSWKHAYEKYKTRNPLLTKY